MSCEDRKGNLPSLRTNKAVSPAKKEWFVKERLHAASYGKKRNKKREAYFVFKFETDCIPINQTSWFQGAPEERNRDWPTHFNVEKTESNLDDF